MRATIFALVAFVVPAFAQGVKNVPNWVKDDLATLDAGQKVSRGFNGPLGHGTGTYTTKDNQGKEAVATFNWISYTNSDGWVQVAFHANVYGHHLRPIQQFKDQLGRPDFWDARSIDGLTWIGMSNDLWADEALGKKYFHEGKTTYFAGGSSAEYVYHYLPLKVDYLDRITKATNGALKFNVAELQTQAKK
jgi:hypothetical protein